MGIILCTFSSGKLKKVGGDFHFFYGCCSSSCLSCNTELKEKVSGAEGGRGKISTDSVTFHTNEPGNFAWIHKDL